MKGGKPGGGAFVPGGIMPGGPPAPGMNGGRGPPAANGWKGGIDAAGTAAIGLAVSSLTFGERLSESDGMSFFIR